MNYLPYRIYAKSSEFEDREIVQFRERICIFAFDKLLEETKRVFGTFRLQCEATLEEAPDWYKRQKDIEKTHVLHLDVVIGKIKRSIDRVAKREMDEDTELLLKNTSNSWSPELRKNV